MTATIATTTNEIAKIEAEAEDLARKNQAAQQRLARLRADQERARQQRLADWAARTLRAFDADRAEADRAVNDAAQAFQATVAAGDLVGALPAYQHWLAEDARRLAVVERFNTALNFRPAGEVRKEIINHRTQQPDFVAAVNDAARGGHLAAIDAATAEIMAEFRALHEGGEAGA